MRHRNNFLVSRVDRDCGDAGVDGSQHRHWAPEKATPTHDVPHSDHFGGVDGPLVLVVLNTKGEGESEALFRHLWARAALRVCADGGANRLHDSFGDHNEDRDGDGLNDTAEQRRARFVPDVIVGDLDSLRPEVAAYYRALGTEVKIHADQDHNDFEKCLMEIERRLGAGESTADAPTVGAGRPERVVAVLGVEATGDDVGKAGSATKVGVDKSEGGRKLRRKPAAVETTVSFMDAATTAKTVATVQEERAHRQVFSSAAAIAAPTAATVIGLGAFGGRFDHEMAAMSVLHTYTSRFSRLVLMGAGNIAFLLAPGVRHVIQPDARFEGPTVGLIPIGGACQSVTTKGLKWNLQAGRLEFGVLVSSSNCVVGKEVTVVTDAPLVWTAEFKAEDWANVADLVER